MIDKYKSITHLHLFSILNTETKGFSDRRRVRILDVGCGNGQLINYLMKSITSLNSTIELEIYGFDVADHGVQKKDFLKIQLRCYLKIFRKFHGKRGYF